MQGTGTTAKWEDDGQAPKAMCTVSLWLLEVCLGKILTLVNWPLWLRCLRAGLSKSLPSHPFRSVQRSHPGKMSNTPRPSNKDSLTAILHLLSWAEAGFVDHDMLDMMLRDEEPDLEHQQPTSSEDPGSDLARGGPLC